MNIYHPIQCVEISETGYLSTVYLGINVRLATSAAMTDEDLECLLLPEIHRAFTQTPVILHDSTKYLQMGNGRTWVTTEAISLSIDTADIVTNEYLHCGLASRLSSFIMDMTDTDVGLDISFNKAQVKESVILAKSTATGIKLYPKELHASLGDEDGCEIYDHRLVNELNNIYGSIMYYAKEGTIRVNNSSPEELLLGNDNRLSLHRETKAISLTDLSHIGIVNYIIGACNYVTCNRTFSANINNLHYDIPLTSPRP